MQVTLADGSSVSSVNVCNVPMVVCTAKGCALYSAV